MIVNLKIPDFFQELYRTKYRYVIYYGGRGGGKSHAIARAVISRMIENPKMFVVCVREVQKSIELSSYKLLCDIIREYVEKQWIDPRFFIIQNDGIKTIDGGVIKFLGLSNITDDNIKSIEGCNICWVEEANTIRKGSLDKLLPSVRAPNSQIFFSYNRNNLFEPVHTTLVTNQSENTFVKKINYCDNPYFPEVLERERIRCKETEPEEVYNHIWLGEPYSEEHLLITPQMILECESHESFHWKDYRPIIGVDVARDGLDYSVILARQNDKILFYEKHKGLHHKELASRACKVFRELDKYEEKPHIFVDGTGLGSGTYDFIADMGCGGQTASVNFGSRDVSDKRAYFNKRAEMYGRMAEFIKERKLEFPPHSDDLKSQLSYIPVDLGREELKIIPKEEIKKELGYSPDIADALALTFSHSLRELATKSDPRERANFRSFNALKSNEEMTRIW
jgi:phage terminase large subunit